MSDRKPLGQSWRSWIDEQVEKAEQEGAFANLPGAGKPIPDLDDNYDENWWLKKLIEREALSIAPEPLEIRRSIEKLRGGIGQLPSEAAVRGAAAAINEFIARLHRMPATPGLTPVVAIDPEEVVRRWRTDRG